LFFWPIPRHNQFLSGNKQLFFPRQKAFRTKKEFHLNLRNKFLLYFSPLIIIVFAFGAYCIITFSAIHNQFSKLQQDVTPNAVAMLELKELLLSLELGIKEKSIDKERLSSKIQQLKKIISTHPDQADTTLNPAEKAAHETMHHAIRTMSLSQYILNQSETGWKDGDLSKVADIIHQELVSLGPILDKHLKIHLQELTKTEAFVTSKYQHTLLVVILASVIVVIVTVVILMAMMRSVLEPVKILQEGAKQIGEGNLIFPMQINSGDEFEFLALEFKKMAAKLSAYHADLDREVKDRTRELQNANTELQNAEEQVHHLSQELLKIQETERQKISLDLHDNVAQELSSLKVASESLFDSAAKDNSPLQKDMRSWSNLLDRCIKTVREISYNLRPPGLEQMGLVSTLQDYCRNLARQTGLHIDFTAAGLDNLRLEYDYAITVYRLIQEALNNIQKHAKATSTEIKLTASFPNLILRIEDNGTGFDLQEGIEKASQENRLGLLGMQERVRMLNGTLSIKSAPQKGTRIFIEIPLKKGNNRNEEDPDR